MLLLTVAKFQEDSLYSLNFRKMYVKCGCGVQSRANIVYNLFRYLYYLCAKFHEYRFCNLDVTLTYFALQNFKKIRRTV